MDELDLDHPCWTDFRNALTGLAGPVFPAASQLNAGLGRGTVSGGSKPIRFVPATQLDETDYETRIYLAGEVSTRADSWHDLFNALCWQAWPCIKSAMNLRHYKSPDGPASGRRSAERDALTLFDECGVVLVSTSKQALDDVAGHQWRLIFGDAECWRSRYRIFITGHAMLEKFLRPYKGMTANALLVEVPRDTWDLPRLELAAFLDQQLGRQIARSALLNSTRELAPLPLSGIPGWWADGPQDRAFYEDKSVFRPLPDKVSRGKITRLRG